MYRLHRETFYLSVDFIDRFLCTTKNVMKHQLQLVGITALFIAAKLEVLYLELHQYWNIMLMLKILKWKLFFLLKFCLIICFMLCLNLLLGNLSTKISRVCICHRWCLFRDGNIRTRTCYFEGIFIVWFWFNSLINSLIFLRVLGLLSMIDIFSFFLNCFRYQISVFHWRLWTGTWLQWQ